MPRRALGIPRTGTSGNSVGARSTRDRGPGTHTKEVTLALDDGTTTANYLPHGYRSSYPYYNRVLKQKAKLKI